MKTTVTMRAAVAVFGVLGSVCQRKVAAWNFKQLNSENVGYGGNRDFLGFDSAPRFEEPMDFPFGAEKKGQFAAIVPHMPSSSSTFSSSSPEEQDVSSARRRVQRTRRRDSGDAMAFTSRRSSNDFSVESSGLETVDVSSSSRVFPSVTCTAAKAILCIGGLAALGAFGVRYTRDYLRRRRRAKFDQGPTPFTKLLGPVLLSNVPESPHFERRATRLRRSGGGLFPSKSSPKEEGTAETLGKQGHVTALYFTGRGVEKMLEGKGYVAFTPRLRSIVEAAESKGQKVDVVYVSADASEGDATEHFQTMPWYAVPFDDKDGREKIRSLFRKFRVTSLPHVVLLDEYGKVINSQAYTSMLANPQGFPWKRQKVLQMLGDSVVNQKGETVKQESLKGRRIGLYFAASWCPPCRSFTPKLVDAIKKLRERGEEVELIFVSSDRDEKSFDEYYKKMEGFYAVPFKNVTTRAILQDNLGVRALPTLIWIDEKGEEVTKRGVPLLISDPDVNSYPWEDKLVYDVVDSVDGIVEEPILIAFIERASENVQQKTVEVLEKAAKVLKEAGDDGSVTPRVRFFTAKTNSPRAAALRQICGRDLGGSTNLGTDGGEHIEVVILDLFNQRVFDIPLNKGEELSAEQLLSAIEKFKAEELLGKPIVLPE